MEPSIHRAEHRDRRGRRLPALALLGIITVIGATWVGLFFFLGGNATFGTLEELEDKYICDVDQMALDFPDLGTLSEVYTSDGVLLGKLTERNSQPVALEEMPDLVVAAVLSAEDKDFYSHEGIDFGAIARAVVENTRRGSLQGGSTITQQVVKQNFLSTERTIERKICEAVIAAELERRYSKDQILEFYVNSVFYGANAYGVSAAAQEYFGKGLDQLTIAEAATLVTPIRNPSFYHPRRFPENVLTARNNVIDEMEANAFIAAEDATTARSAPLGVGAHQGFEDLSPQVMIAVRQELLRNPEYGLGDTYTDRKRAVFGCPAADTTCEGGGGLRIHITVDYEMQEEANRILRNWFRPGFDGPTGAIAMVENDTGAVRVMASGLEFGTDIEAGQRPYDLATQGGRQSGSAFKVFTLAAALENGDLLGSPITLGSYWDYSSPADIDCGFPCSEGGNIWTVHNAGGSSDGIRTLESATYASVNAVYARLVDAVGPAQVVDMAHRLGIESPLRAYPSITLGVFNVTPLEMASAYSTLANYGERVPHYLVDRIEDAAGNLLYRHQNERHRELDEAISAAVVGTLEQVVSGGTGQRANIERPQAGKTGTATDYKDVWFVGFIPQYTTSVWVGYADRQDPLEQFTVWNDLAGNEQFYRRAFGGTIAAPIWKQFMLSVTERLPIADFGEAPPGTEKYLQTPFATVPDLTDLPGDEAKAALYAAGLAPEFISVDSLLPEGTVAGQGLPPGTRIRQGGSLIVEVSTGVPPSAPLVDVVGLPLEDASARFLAFTEDTGVLLNWVVEQRPVEDAAQWGRVVGTSPSPGTVVGYEQNIVVFVGVSP